MAFPLANKPTARLEHDNTEATLGAAMRAYVVLNDDVVRDLATNKLGFIYLGHIQQKVGPPGEWVNVAVGDATAYRGLKFRQGDAGFAIRGAAWNGDTPYPRTVFATFSPHFLGMGTTNGQLYYSLVCGAGQDYSGTMDGAFMITLRVNTNGVIDLGWSRVNSYFTDSGIDLENDHVYSVSLTRVAKTSSNVLINVYDHTTQTLTAQATVSDTGTWNSSSGKFDFLINPGYNDGSPLVTGGNAVRTFQGVFFCGGLSDVTWDTGTNGFWEAYYQNPLAATKAVAAWTPATTTYTPGWCFCQGYSTAGVTIACARPTGGSGALGEDYEYRVCRGTTMDFTPGDATALNSYGAAYAYTDTTGTPGTFYYYAFQARRTAGDQTVLTTAKTAARRLKSLKRLVFIGASDNSGTTSTDLTIATQGSHNALVRNAFAHGHCLILTNMARASTGFQVWQPGDASGNLAEAIRQGEDWGTSATGIFSVLGANDAWTGHTADSNSYATAQTNMSGWVDAAVAAMATNGIMTEWWQTNIQWTGLIDGKATVSTSLEIASLCAIYNAVFASKHNGTTFFYVGGNTTQTDLTMGFPCLATDADAAGVTSFVHQKDTGANEISGAALWEGMWDVLDARPTPAAVAAAAWTRANRTLTE